LIPRRALITGIAGQDGSYLAELLLARGYAVYGIARGAPEDPLPNLDHIRDRIELTRGEVTDSAIIRRALSDVEPAEVYHLAAPTFVPDSWADPATTMNLIAVAGASLLQNVRELAPGARVFVASSGEMFGDTPSSPQSESTPPHPSNPYAISKLAQHQLVGVLRGNGLHVSSGITFNHESERRPERFVTRKVARAAAAISLGLENELSLGSMDAVRDWSHAADVMRAAWMMLQHDPPDDYVIASGVGHTVADFVTRAFAHVGLDPADHIRTDPALVRTPDPSPRIGDPSHIRKTLGWEPEWTFEQLVQSMVDADLRRLAG